MKKAITITFGLIGLIFGLVFSPTKIQGAEITSGIYTYYGKKNNNNNIFEVYAPELTTVGESQFLNYRDFFDRFETLTGDNYSLIIMNFDSMNIEYEDGADVNYWGYTDTIIIEKNTTDNVSISFLYIGELKETFNIDYFVPYQYPFVKIITDNETFYNSGYESGLYDGYANGYQAGYDQGYLVGMNENETSYGQGYNQGYDIGYRKGKWEGQEEGFNKGWQGGLETGKEIGFNNGYKEGVSTVYENGFGGVINPDTNNPYDETASYPYGQGYNDGLLSTESGGLWAVLFSAILAPFQVLGIEMLPGVTLGMIVAVPLVFGLLAWILSAGKSKK